jgi:hypothetical protein
MTIIATASRARRGACVVSRPVGDGRDAGGASGAVEQRDAVEKERGCEAAQQEVLDGGLGGRGAAFAEAGEDVGGDGGDLQADEDHQELDRAGHEHHAGGAKEDEREVLAGVGDHPSGHARRGPRGDGGLKVVQRAEQRDQHDGGDEQMEEDREGVYLQG